MSDAEFAQLHAPRLILRRFRAADLEAFVRYRAEPAIARYQSWENFTRADGEAFLGWLARQQPDTPGEWFQFAVERAADGAMIGDCAMRPLDEDPDAVEIGFTLAPEHHGRGYAKEAVGRLLDYLFAARGKQRAIAITDARNAPSIAAIERLGFIRDETPRAPVPFKGELVEEYHYAIERDAWLARRAAG